MPSTRPEQGARPTDRPPGAPGQGSLAVLWRQLVAFTGIGIVLTVAYLGLYAVLREVMGAQSANLVSWVVTAVADTSANRRLTFGLSGRAGALRAQVEGMLVFALGLAITSGSLVALDAVVTSHGTSLEVAVLAVSNLVAGLLRFALLRWWVFAPGHGGAASDPGGASASTTAGRRSS